MRAAYQRARAIDPNDPSVLAMGASIKAIMTGTRGRSRRSLQIRRAGAEFGTWNDIGLILESRDAPIESEAAFRRAIALDPEDPIAYGNLAILLLDQSRVDEAGALIDTALAADPSNPAALTFRGRYLLQKGDWLPPGLYAGRLRREPRGLGRSFGARRQLFQNGELELADQALDNVGPARSACGDRLHPAHGIRPRRLPRRRRHPGGARSPAALPGPGRRFRRHFGQRQSGSYPVEAYRFINLHDWARYYADRTFDPFQATGYLDQAIVSRPGVFVTKPTLSTVEGVDVEFELLQPAGPGSLARPARGLGPDRTLRPAAAAVPRRRNRRRRNRPRQQARLGAGRTVNGFTDTPFPTSFTFGIVAEFAPMGT